METKTERKYVCYDRRFLSTGLDIANMILLTEIENLSKLPNGCYANDEQLGRLILICAKSTNERIKYLEKCGYIKCNTIFINKKRRRSISFTYVEGNPSQDGITKRSHKKKVNPSQDGLPHPPRDGYNKLYKEVNTGIPESDHRNAVKEDSDQTRLELENTGSRKENLVEVTPTRKILVQNVPDSSLRFGVVGDIKEDQEDEIMDEKTFKELRKLLNEELKPIYPNWEKSLINNPLEIFLSETERFHERRIEFIEMFKNLKLKFQPAEYTI
jgi:hypothetical protein